MINIKIIAIKQKIWEEYCNKARDYSKGIPYEGLYINYCDGLYPLEDGVHLLNESLRADGSDLMVVINRNKKILLLAPLE
jgi:hypothetical protein